MLVSIKLQNNLSCEYICSKVQYAINCYMKEFNDATDAMVIIDIRKPTEDTTLVPKIEFKPITT